MVKAIGLLSGGLDSTLAVKLMLDQGIDVVALNFITPFCNCTRKGCRHEASKVAKNFGIKIKVVFAGEEYIKIVRNPKYGYGKNMNPCIDCRIFMFKKAKEYMEKEGASFIFTGEVLGQRPMSQRKKIMKLIEREAGLEGLIVRPLSAHFLEPTIPEKEGIVDRSRLLAIKGRSRKQQMKLAEKFDIKDYPCPAGGCKLTDKHFSERLRDAFEHGEYDLGNISLLKYGRHFRLPDGVKIVVGRNEMENLAIKRLAREDDLLMEVVGFGSPITLLRGDYTDEDIKIAASICVRYSDCKNMAKIRIKSKEKEKIIFAEPMDDKDIRTFMIGGKNE